MSLSEVELDFEYSFNWNKMKFYVKFITYYILDFNTCIYFC